MAMVDWFMGCFEIDVHRECGINLDMVVGNRQLIQQVRGTFMLKDSAE